MKKGFLRKALALAVAATLAVGAVPAQPIADFFDGLTLSAKAADPVKYIDEDGVEQTITEYTVLTSSNDGHQLTGGKYVVMDDVEVSGSLYCTGDVELIVCDGKTLTITNTSGCSIFNLSNSVKIFGQSDNSGKIIANASNETFFVDSYNQYGAVVEAVSTDSTGIFSCGDVLIKGGSLDAKGNCSGIYAFNNAIFAGGVVNAVSESENFFGVNADTITNDISTITLSGGIIKSNSYSKDLTIAEGKTYATPDGGEYTSTSGISAAAAENTLLAPKNAGYVFYINEAGEDDMLQPGQYTELKSSMGGQTLDGGTYVVKNDVTISGQLNFTGDTKLVIMDGKKLTVTNEEGVGILIQKDPNDLFSDKDLSIYGQKNSTGKLIVESTDHSVSIKNYKQYGCDVSLHATGYYRKGLCASGNVVMSGGRLNTVSEKDSGIYADNVIHFNKGIVIADNKSSGADILNLNKVFFNGAVVTADKYYDYGDNILVLSKDYTNGTSNFVAGTQLTETDTNGKTLMPQGTVPYIDENGDEAYLMPGEYTELTQASFEDDYKTLEAGTYYVSENITFGYQIVLNGDATFIIKDDVELNIDSICPIFAYGKTLTITGQSKGTGKLSVNGYDGIECKNYIQNGATVVAIGNSSGFGLNADNDITLNGGMLEVQNGIQSKEGTITLTGGTVKADSYNIVPTIAAGKTYVDEQGNEYTSETENLATAVAGKWIAEKSASVPYIGADGKTKYALAGQYTELSDVLVEKNINNGYYGIPGGIYVISGSIDKSEMEIFFKNADTTLIIKDSAELKARYINAYDLTVFGQSGNTGKLIVNNTYNNGSLDGLDCGQYIQYGADVSLYSTEGIGICAFENIILNGGRFEANSAAENYNGISVYDGRTITLAGGTVKASKYKIAPTIAEGVTYLDEDGNIYTNTTGITADAAAGKLLTPAYTITYVLGGGTNAAANPAAYTPGTAVALKNPTRTGYTFTGWTMNSTAVTSIPATATGDITLTAGWSVNSYKVTLNTNGGTINKGNVTRYTYGTAKTLPTDVTREGYTFEGWYANKNLTGNPVKKITAGSTGSKTYYAKWSAIDCTITYNLNGGSNNEANPDTYNADSEDITLAAPEREGYTFTGWTFEGQTEPTKDVTIAQGSTGDREFTANWSAIDCTISYKLNGGSNNEANPDTYNADSEDITLAAPEREGYTFTGWTFEGQTEPTKDVTIAQGSTGDREFTANWQINTYKVTFAEGAADEQTVEHGKAAAQPADPKKEGYIFMGWLLGDKAYDFETPVTADITITPDWEEIVYTLVPAVAPTCEDDGNDEYYTGSDGKFYVKQEGKYTETTLAKVTKGAYGHKLVRVDFEDSTFESEGNIEHYKCERCGRLFADNKAKDELTQEDVVIPRKVKKKILGDADGDGKFTVRDVALVKQYLANWKVTIDLDNSDINGDGKVTVKDLVYMKQKLAGWNTEYFDR